MRQLAVSVMLASALFAIAGAVFFARSVSRPDGPGGSSPTTNSEKAEAALNPQMVQLLERLNRLEGAVAALERDARRRPPDHGAGLSVKTGPGEPKKETLSKDEEALLEALEGKEAGGLRSFVKQAIQEELEEGRRAAERRAQEMKNQIEELGQGPYGRFNVRVNFIQRRLALNEFQKQRFYALLTEYSARLEEIRQGLNKEDKAALEAYREGRKQMEDEFDGLVIQILTPPQAQDYQELPSTARSPAPEAVEGTIKVALITAEREASANLEGYRKLMRPEAGSGIPKGPAVR